MAATQKRKIPIWLRIVLALALAAVVLAGSAVLLRYWITSDGGRGFLVSQLDGRRVGPLGAIRISGLDGDPLTDATIADLAFVDDDGVWLRARDARIEWSPFRLLRGSLEIAAVDIRIVEVLRRPRTTYEAERRPPADIDIALEAITIRELNLAQGVLGPAASFVVSGGVARSRDASGSVRLDIATLAGPGDRIEADGKWTAEGAVAGDLTATGPANGALAALLQSPDGEPVTLSAALSGSLNDFAGEARLNFGGAIAADLTATREGDSAALVARIDAGRWPLLDPVARRTGGTIAIDARADLADFERSAITVDVSAPVGRLRLASVVNLEGLTLLAPVRVFADDLDLALVSPPLAGRLDADGEARVAGWSNWSWTGSADVVDLAFPSGSAVRAAGPVTIARSDANISWSTQGAVIADGRIASLENLAPGRYELSTRGEFNLATNIVEITQAQVKGRAGEFTARGAYVLETGALELSGAAALTRLADFAPLTGSARGQWTVTRGAAGRALRVTAEAAGRNVGSRISVLQDLAGSEPRIVLSAVVDDGRFTIESGRFDGSGLTAAMTGRVSDSGVLTARASGLLRRPLDVGGAAIQSLRFSADIAGSLSAPRIDLDLDDVALDIAGLSLTGVTGEAQATLGERVTGRYALTGSLDGEPLSLSGGLAGRDGAWRLTDGDARIAGLTILAPLVSYADGDLSASFSARGSLARLSGFESGTLDASGEVSSSDGALALDLSGQATDIRRGAAGIQLVSLNARTAGAVTELSGRLRGRIGAELDLTFIGDAVRSGSSWSGEASATGQIDQLPVSTARPVSWAYGPEGWSADGAFSALNGRIDATLASGGAGHSTRVALSGIDLAALTRLARVNPMSGRISGSSTFSNVRGVATGDLSLAIADANPLGVTSDPLSVALEGQLRDRRFTATARGSGQGFQLEANALIPFDVGAGFNVAPSPGAPIEASFDLAGRAEQLWALFGPEGQTMRGALTAQIRVAGTLASPTIDGGFEMCEGVYQHGETGLSLRQIDARGMFNQRSARIESLTATDGAGGRLTAEGDIDWSSALAGGVRFTAANLRALARDDRSAVVSGEGAVTIQPDAYVVTGNLRVLQARLSIEQPASASIPTLPGVRRVNFPASDGNGAATREPGRPVRLDLKITAPRRIVVFGRGLDTEWSADLAVTGLVSDPAISGTATLVRGTLDLAGQRFDFDAGSIRLDGPVRSARIDIAAKRDADDVDAIARVTGTLGDLEFTLESTPALPQDEILARVLFGRSAAELSGLEAAQLAASLTQLAGGQAAFDPAGAKGDAAGLDRVAFGASGGAATVQAGKYIADDVYLELGAGGEGGVGAQVEWEPVEGVSITSGAQGNGDSRIAVRWKKDY